MESVFRLCNSILQVSTNNCRWGRIHPICIQLSEKCRELNLRNSKFPFISTAVAKNSEGFKFNGIKCRDQFKEEVLEIFTTRGVTTFTRYGKEERSVICILSLLRWLFGSCLLSSQVDGSPISVAFAFTNDTRTVRDEEVEFSTGRAGERWTMWQTSCPVTNYNTRNR